MLPIVESLNYILALGTVALQLVIAIIVVGYIWRGTELGKTITELVQRFAFPLAFLSALGGTIMTLVYSDYFGFIPCGLCWFQRIALYPQILLLGIGWYKKDRTVWLYVLLLSIFGLVYALYNHYLQVGGTVHLPCPASGGDCGQRFLFEFDYITFPLMAATLFVWQGLIAYLSLKKK